MGTERGTTAQRRRQWIMAGASALSDRDSTAATTTEVAGRIGVAPASEFRLFGSRQVDAE
ncbi:hypothetical protein [Micromonospora sp. NPDC048898]|uniref:hypothetical protein n=1 Tax=Micromonospora sp. NPDC048898 TaxID=3364260 RepID=UPI003721D9FA